MDLVEDPSKATSAILDDKITDFCNYALLLRAILEEENEASR